MRIQRTFITRELDSSARSCAISTLQNAGYHLVSSGRPMLFKRGSGFGSILPTSYKSRPAQAVVQTRTMENGDTQVIYVVEVNSSVQERMWQDEADLFVVALGGMDVDDGRKDPYVVAAKNYNLERQIKGGASWFYWIAGLSLINTILYIAGQNWTFVVGLGVTQLIDGIAHLLAEGMPENSYILIRMVGFILNLIVAGIFVLFGYLAGQKNKTAFILGMVFYALDALILLLATDWLSIIFHMIALFGILRGLIAINGVKKAPEGRPLAIP